MSSIHVSRRGGSDESRDLIDRFDFELWLDEEGVDYKITSGSSGEQINIKECPRCGGARHKVFINRETGLGNCFHGSCVGEPGFNKFTFLKHYTNETGRVVFEIMQEQAEELGWRPKQEKKKIETYVPDEIILPKSTELPVQGRNLKYLTQRNISLETTEYFNLRYCVHGWYKYVDYEGKERFQFYGKRVIIPLYDIEGKLVTWQGRDVSGEADKKYLFPPGLPSTGRYLYNAHNVDTSSVVMGEGAFDVYAIHQALKQFGLDKHYTAIGSFGISFSTGEGQQIDELKKLIEKGVDTLIFMWDGSKQAIDSAYKFGIKIKAMTGISVKLATLPLDKDPNEVEQDIVIEAIANATPISKIAYIKHKAKRRA